MRARARPRRARRRRARCSTASTAVAATSREPQFIGPLAALRAELERRTGDLDAARAGDRRRPRPHRVLLGGRAPDLARCRAAGVRVEADAAVRARDLGDASAERSPRPLRRRCCCARSRRPRRATVRSRTANLASARADAARVDGRGRSGAVGRGRERVDAPSERPYAPPRPAGARPRRGSPRATATARRPRRPRRARRGPRASARAGSRPRSRASRRARLRLEPDGDATGDAPRHAGERPVRAHAARAPGARAAGRRPRRTGRSAPRSTWPRRPPPSTSPGSSPSSTCARGRRPRRSRTGWGSLDPQRGPACTSDGSNSRSTIRRSDASSDNPCARAPTSIRVR